MKENRRFTRVNVSVPAEFRGSHVWQVKKTFDLSAGGMFLVTKNIEPPGAMIELIFSAGKENALIHASAVVVWVRLQERKRNGIDYPAGMGIRFLKIFPVNGGEILKGLI